MTSTDDWTEPGAYPVAPGVYRVPLPLPYDGLRAVNVYVVETDEGLVLIDAGWALDSARQQLESSLREIGHKVHDISRFLVTHIHRDHYTQAVAIRREFGAAVSLGVGEEPNLRFIREYTEGRQSPQVPRLRDAGGQDLIDGWQQLMRRQAPDLTNWEPPDTWLTETTLESGNQKMEAIATPGHTQGHVVFADFAAGVLFAGDHVLPHITPSIGFEPAATRSALSDYLGSLTKVRSLPDLRLLPAHGPVVPSAHRRVDELLAHHEERLEACMTAVADGCETAYEVAQQLRWTRRERRLSELDPFNAVLATLETLAHMDLLVARGRLVSARGDGAVHFGLAPGDDAAPSTR